MNSLGKYAKLTAHNGETLYTNIYQTTAAEVIKEWLIPGYWKEIKFLSPIVTEYPESGVKSLLLSVYAVSDEDMEKYNLDYKYRAESVTVCADNTAFINNGAIA